MKPDPFVATGEASDLGVPDARVGASIETGYLAGEDVPGVGAIRTALR